MNFRAFFLEEEEGDEGSTTCRILAKRLIYANGYSL
jgi:hypothetical protein